MKFKRIAIDTSKHVFTLHGVDEQERPVLRRELKRAQMEGFFAKQEATEVVLEACSGSHHLGRLLSRGRESPGWRSWRPAGRCWP
jgi:transposase